MPAACCFLLFWPAPGAAEEADAAQTSDAAVPRQGLEEITVSAERRDQDLQKVPAAISAFSGDDIDKRGLTNFNQLQYSHSSPRSQHPGHLVDRDARRLHVVQQHVGETVIGAAVTDR